MKWILRGINFQDVVEVIGKRGNCTIRLEMKDGSEHIIESYPGEDFYTKCCTWLAMAQKEQV
jgi:hypothetical protein